jgi:site-specific recombinase XerC
MGLCKLPSGEQVSFTLKRRPRDPFYLVCFRGPHPDPKKLGQITRLEKTTKTANKKRAELASDAIICKAYGQTASEFVTWDAAIERLCQATGAQNLRPGTVEQYVVAISNLRKVFDTSQGPADITPANAQAFVDKRTTDGKSKRTIAGNVTNLSIVFGRWFRDTCKIIKADPFADIEPPKQDKPAPRIISDDERQAFVTWLLKRWDNWRLPLLFLEIKAAIGCRIGELASLKTENVKDGRLVFVAETTKGRKERAAKLPLALFKELKAQVGPTYAFERFADELRAIHVDRGLDRIAARVGPFSPERMFRWLQDELKTYCRKTGAKRFKWHNFRGTAMSKARELGVSCDDASVAFGCNPETMRKHYVAVDEQPISDSVFDRLHGMT